MNIMAKKQVLLMPSSEKILAEMGQRIKLARLRRQISVELVAERAGVSRSTVWAVEKGSPSVAMGFYAAVLNSIGMVKDLELIAKDDVLGKTLQDLELPTRERAPKAGRV